MPIPDKELLGFLEEKAKTNDFARSLLEGKYGYQQRGFLTEPQIAAAERMQSEHVAKAEIAVEIAESEDTGLDLTPLPAGRYAVPDGRTRLKVLVRKVDKPGDNWDGYIFVSNAAVYGDRQRYGNQPPGQNYRGRIVTQLKAIMADPLAASIAYGKLTGTCGICGKTLENELSVAAGIGPWCAAKFGVSQESIVNDVTLESL